MSKLVVLPQRVAPEALAAGFRDSDSSHATGLKLLHAVRASGLSLRGYLSYACDPTLSQNEGLKAQKPLSALFSELKLPVSSKGELSSALMAASSDSFATNSGLQVFLPVIIENLLREKDPQPPLENVADFVAQSREVAGTEVVTRAEWEGSEDDTFNRFIIPEGANIPTRSIRGTESNVKIYKIGSGLEISYETMRRLSPAMLVPYAAKMEREATQARAAQAALTLLNGDGAHPVAEVVNITSYQGDTTGLSKNAGAFLRFLMSRAQKGRAVTTIAVNYDSLAELMLMFPNQNGTAVSVGAGAALPNGMLSVQLPAGIRFNLKVAISSQVPEGRILCYDGASTLEELIETGSNISEQEKAMGNQMIRFYSTVNSGFKYAIDETRIVLNWKA